MRSWRDFAVADPAFGQGRGTKFLLELAEIAKWSQVSQVSQYWLGSGACLTAVEALAFLDVKYAFWHLSSNF